VSSITMISEWQVSRMYFRKRAFASHFRYRN